ncbi:MAG: superoxide dismutase, Ni [Pseudomonadota bacterium]|nr:superoxide dismutase, Ni [Pseudomonadota bacterium]
MFHKLLNVLDKKIEFNVASAHCDVPCGIYDPAIALINALTVVRIMDLIQELKDKETLSFNDQARLSRLMSEKEKHVGVVKEEVRIIWGDFMKASQFEKFPETHELVHTIMLQSSKCRQDLGREYATDLLASVNKFAEVFWACKGVETYRAVCPYAPNEEAVYPKLG